MQSHDHPLSHFFIAGINYKKTDAGLRGNFSINTDQYQKLVSLAPSFNIREFFVLSTCNRTEIYGICENPESLCALLTSQTIGSFPSFKSMAYIKNGQDAVRHLFNVAAGLDSQILGDYEIVGQIRQASRFSKQNDCLHSTLERLVNDVLQASKKIRTHTGLSGGTVSVSFAAIQYIRSKFPDQSGKNILLVGTGKFGCNTCKNLADYLPGFNVTLTNRTLEKAISLSETYGFKYDHFQNLENLIEWADIILVATHADSPVVLQQHFKNGNKVVIDLSVPCNVEGTVRQLPGVTLVNVDELSRIKDETLQMRALEIPKAKAIINEHVLAFLEWHRLRLHVPVLKAVKVTLLSLESEIPSPIGTISVNLPPKPVEERIQKVINGMAVKMKTRNEKGCNYIEAINDYLTPATELK